MYTFETNNKHKQQQNSCLFISCEPYPSLACLEYESLSICDNPLFDLIGSDDAPLLFVVIGSIFFLLSLFFIILYVLVYLVAGRQLNPDGGETKRPKKPDNYPITKPVPANRKWPSADDL